jgi:hypothetical protein
MNLNQMTAKFHITHFRTNSKQATNRCLAQWQVMWLIELSTSHQLLWCVDETRPNVKLEDTVAHTQRRL